MPAFEACEQSLTDIHAHRPIVVRHKNEAVPKATLIPHILTFSTGACLFPGEAGCGALSTPIGGYTTVTTPQARGKQRNRAEPKPLRPDRRSKSKHAPSGFVKVRQLELGPENGGKYSGARKIDAARKTTGDCSGGVLRRICVPSGDARGELLQVSNSGGPLHRRGWGPSTEGLAIRFRAGGLMHALRKTIWLGVGSTGCGLWCRFNMPIHPRDRQAC